VLFSPRWTHRGPPVLFTALGPRCVHRGL